MPRYIRFASMILLIGLQVIGKTLSRAVPASATTTATAITTMIMTQARRKAATEIGWAARIVEMTGGTITRMTRIRYGRDSIANIME
jgi:hypothetical protein